jgi:hypothetical protein
MPYQVLAHKHRQRAAGLFACHADYTTDAASLNHQWNTREALPAREEAGGAKGCTLVTRAHIHALGRDFYEVEKDGKKRYQTIGDSFFSFY